MGEVWAAAAVTVGGALISGYAKSKQQEKANEQAQAMTKEESELAAQRTGYEKGLDYYYKQKDRFERQRGLDQFRQFSTMNQFAPTANTTAGRIASLAMPTYNQFSVEPPPEVAKKGGGGGGRSIGEKLLDPHNFF